MGETVKALQIGWGAAGEVGTLDQQQVQQGLGPHDRPGARTTPDPSAL